MPAPPVRKTQEQMYREVTQGTRRVEGVAFAGCVVACDENPAASHCGETTPARAAGVGAAARYGGGGFGVERGR